MKMVSLKLSPNLELEAHIPGAGNVKFRLDRRSAQILAIGLREYAGAPPDLLERGARLNGADFFHWSISGALIEDSKRAPVVRIKRGVVRIIR